MQLKFLTFPIHAYIHIQYKQIYKCILSLAAVPCGLAPIPKFGMIIYDNKIRGNTTDYGVTGTYRCLPPYVLIGNPRAECAASGTWTETPECRGMEVGIIMVLQDTTDLNNAYMS